jgi:hypothetical protein
VALLDAARPFPSFSRDDAEDTRREATPRLQTLEQLLADEKKTDERDPAGEHKWWGCRGLINFLAQVEGAEPTYLENVEELAALLTIPHVGPRVSALLNQDEALSQDWADGVETLAPLWPDFLLLVASRFKALWDNGPAHQGKMHNILSAAKSDVDQAIPTTPSLCGLESRQALPPVLCSAAALMP